MATEFQVVEAETAPALKIAVDILLAAGWAVVGGVVIDKNPSYVSGVYGQEAPLYSIAMQK